MAPPPPAQTLSVQGNGLFSGNLSIAGLTATGTVAFTGLGSGGPLSINDAGNVVSTTSIGVKYGGTGLTSYAGNQLLYTNAAGTVFATVATSSPSFSIGGNAATATALQTPRTINGISFDGTGNITITAASSTLLTNNNTFSGANIFTGGLTTNSLTIAGLNGPLQANNGVVSATTSVGVLYGGTASTTLGGLLTGNGTGALTSANVTTATGITFSANTLSLAAIPNASLSNSTISGVALGGNLLNLTATDSTLTFSGSYNGSTARTVGLNLANANTWTALQQFNGGASTTQLTTTGNTYLATLGGSVGIGSTTPESTLTVSTGNAVIGTFYRSTATGGTIEIRNNVGSVFAGVSGIGNFGINIGSTNLTNAQLTVASGGFVGIGTSTPTRGLSIANNTGGATGTVVSPAGISINDTDAGNGWDLTNPFTSIDFAAPNEVVYGTRARLGLTMTSGNGNNSRFGIFVNDGSVGGAALERLSITQGGNVGIGTTTPSAMLALGVSNADAVFGDLVTGSALRFVGSNAAGAFVQAGNSSTDTGSILTLNRAFSTTASLSKLNVLADAAYFNGLVGIGTTTPYAQLSIGGGNLVLGAATAGGTPGDLFLPKLGTAAGSFLAIDATGKVIATTTPAGGGGSTIGTTGQVGYFSNTNTLTGTSTLFITPAGTIGIGTTTTTGTINLYNTNVAGAFPSIVLGGNPGGDTDFWLARQNDNDTADDDYFQIGVGLTPGTAPALTLDNAGRVGIGTTTPGYLLNLATSTKPQLALSDGSLTNNAWAFRSVGGNLYIGTSSPSTYATSSNNMSTISLTSGGQAGFVGIGSSTPWGKLSVEIGPVSNPSFVIANQGSTSPALYVGGANQNGVVGIGTTTPGNNAIFGIAGNSYLQGTLSLESNSATALTVGRVGATNPALTVNAATASSVTGISITSGVTGGTTAIAATDSGTNSSLSIASKGNGNIVLNSGTGAVIGGTAVTSTLTLRGYNAAAPTTAAVILGAGTTEIARIAAAGVGIGTTTPRGGSLVIASSTAPQLALTDASATGSIWSFRTQFSNLYIGSTTPNTYATATVASMTFANDGGIVLGAPTGGSKGLGTLNATTVYANNVALTSDVRYKTNVQDLNTATGLNLIRQLRPVSYNWIDSKMGTESQLGFIAQEVQQLAPELVNVGNDKDHTLALNYIGLISPAVQAIQQLALQGDSLSLATSSLSTRISTLEARMATSTQVMPQPLSATVVTAESMQIANGVSAGTMTMQSANVDGTVSASRYVVPQTASTFAMGSTTISAVLPEDVVTSGGMVDLYKLASYGVASVQALANRTDLLTVRIDDLESRLAALETLQIETASSTEETGIISGTLSGLKTALASLGIVVKDGFAMINKLVTTQLVLTDGEDGTSSTGTEMIPAGITELNVTNPLVHTSSKIFLTFTSSIDGAWYISEKKEGSFTLTLANAQPYATDFDYFLIQTDPNAQVAGVAETTPPPPAGIPEAPSNPGSVSEEGGPTVSLTGSAAVQIPQGAPWTDPGATATAADGTILTSTITVSGSVDSSTAGLYTITYSVTDAAGKEGQVSRLVTVLAPTMTPSEPPAVTEAPSEDGDGTAASAPDGTPAS